MKQAARIAGILWMIAAGISWVFMASYAIKRGIPAYGLGGSRDALTIMGIAAIPGYLLYRWGSKGQKFAKRS